MTRVLSVVGVAVLVATACSSRPPAPSPPPSATTETARAGGRIVTGSISDIRTLQPIVAADPASLGVTSLLYPGLLRTDPDTSEPKPGLAATFERSADGLTVTYRLRAGLVWSDGEPFTGDDYKYTAEAVARSRRTARKAAFQDVVGWNDYVSGKADEVRGIRVKDGGRTIEIALTRVLCPALRDLADAGGAGIIPKHSFLVGWNNRSTDLTKSIDDHPLNMAPPASMGPFVFKRWTPGVQVSLTRNERYYLGRPLADDYVVKVYADPAALKAALLTGEVAFGAVPPADADELKTAGKGIVTLYRTEGASSYAFVSWNANAARARWLADRRVRQALWYGVDVAAMIAKVLSGYGHRVFAHTPQASWAYSDPGLGRYPYDPARAKSLLDAAGATMGPDGVYRWTDGRPMEVRIEASQGVKATEAALRMLVDQYRQIGIKVDPLLESFAALSERAVPQNTELEGALLSWSTGLDPDAYPIWHSSQQGDGQLNWVHYSSPVVDRALEAGRSGPDCSLAARRTAYAAVNRALNEDAPYTFLYGPDDLVSFNDSIKGIAPKPYSPSSLWNVQEWWIGR